MTPDYDTLDGITAYLRCGRTGLHDLVKARADHIAADMAPLKPWLLFGGRMWLNPMRTYGSSAQAVWWQDDTYKDPEAPPQSPLPLVQEGKPALAHTYTLRFLPAVNARCALCGRPWVVDNLEDFERDHAPGEATWHHLTCRGMQATAHMETMLRSALTLAGEPLFKLVPVPNRYWPKNACYAWAADWFEIMLPYGKVVVGRRKRVVSIEWTGDDLFADCEDTHDRGLVHAYTWEVAAARLSVVLRYLKAVHA